MKILVDTHIILLALAEDEKLPSYAKSFIKKGVNSVYYSPISTYEVTIKNLKHPDYFDITPEQFVRYCDEMNFIELPLMNDHAFCVRTLRRQSGFKHNDPFDRILLAQAKAEELMFLTLDHAFDFYDEDCIIRIDNYEGRGHLNE